MARERGRQNNGKYTWREDTKTRPNKHRRNYYTDTYRQERHMDSVIGEYFQSNELQSAVLFNTKTHPNKYTDTYRRERHIDSIIREYV